METVGSLIDKMSINELKIYHMIEQSKRDDITEDFRKDCLSRLDILKMQRNDLKDELQQLMYDIASGKKHLKLKA